MKITWLLQGGFIFDVSGQRIVVDAYLSDIVEARQKLTRLSHPPIPLDRLRPDMWICTHDHLDHLDPLTVPKAAAMYPKCRFIGPGSVCRHLQSINIDAGRITQLSRGNSLDISDTISLRAVSACHSDPDAIGLILKLENKRIYLSGDTEWTDILRQEMHRWGAIDLALICINGKLGNMNAEQAIELIQKLRPSLAIPIHYGLFAENTVDPASFIDDCQKAGVPSFAMEAGKEFEV